MNIQICQPMATPHFSFARHFDPARLHGAYRQKCRLHIPDILEAVAANALFAELEQRSDWQQTFNVGERLYDLSSADRAAFSDDVKHSMSTAVDAQAVESFSYRFETIRVSDSAAERARADTILEHFAAFLCSNRALDWFRAVTGLSEIAFVDAQGTRYFAGDFLTAHDDAVEGKDRLAAYVFNFTPQWRAEWGGLLMFHGSDGHIDEALVPCWNALNIFTVPQVHSVSRVVPAVPVARYSITGWLRG